MDAHKNSIAVYAVIASTSATTTTINTTTTTTTSTTTTIRTSNVVAVFAVSRFTVHIEYRHPFPSSFLLNIPCSCYSRVYLTQSPISTWCYTIFILSLLLLLLFSLHFLCPADHCSSFILHSLANTLPKCREKLAKQQQQHQRVSKMDINNNSLQSIFGNPFTISNATNNKP